MKLLNINWEATTIEDLITIQLNFAIAYNWNTFALSDTFMREFTIPLASSRVRVYL